jgi:hypothetical protein
MKKQIERSSKTDQCTWLRFTDEWDYETTCGNYFEDTEIMDLQECGFVYCPFCGHKIVWEAVEAIFLQ